jgi:hypothetical protein
MKKDQWVHTVQITDDSGLLFLVNLERYQSYVNDSWDWDEMAEHLKQEMRKRNIIGWGTGAEGNHLVMIRFGISQLKGFREAERYIFVSAGTLCLLNYEEISYAAMYEDVVLPPVYMKETVLKVPNGDYKVRIVQLDDPDDDFSDEYQEGLRFVLELEPLEKETAEIFDDIPWFSEDGF